ncbi:NAD-dependent epimerase/dehydratase [Halovivax asiaticus JCM 14624]|uniref:NAD-dependent epimerase/dehydratase n=1 Tax=Halovivax asiaticus JCM 14624 TaxID=1227490 RepID=M0BS23_9EURY|nr:NAD(P)-dependent oxidoreductase [Halovivax asiaticus]ELZ13806.1 NAD-dependent epimerase/dehydratase [Halovivax asiaticus JCM 14624]
MAIVAITGGTGNVGRQALDALDEHETTVLARSDADDIDVVTLDVTDRDRFVEVLDGYDTLVHLAANPSPWASWDEVLDANVDGTYNAYHAAVENDLDRVVFASTNHTMHMYNAADTAEPESLVEQPRPVFPDDTPRPDSPYGISKVAGEAIGTYFADRYGLTVVNLRIGWLLDDESLRETQSEDDDHARFARAMYLSPRDCRDALRKSVTHSIEESPLTCHVVSANDERYFSIVEAQTDLGYRPRDNARRVLDSETSADQK